MSALATTYKPPFKKKAIILKTLMLVDLPHFSFRGVTASNASQIACYLRMLVAKHQLSESPDRLVHLRIPSVLDLAGLFRCSELDILDALYELKEESYQYSLMGLDGLITLLDPHMRTPRECTCWEKLAKFLHPKVLLFSSRPERKQE